MKRASSESKQGKKAANGSTSGLTNKEVDDTEKELVDNGREAEHDGTDVINVDTLKQPDANQALTNSEQQPQ